MGDKSPKSVQKQAGQKTSRDSASKQRKDDTEAAKRVAAPATPAPKK